MSNIKFKQLGNGDDVSDVMPLSDEGSLNSSYADVFESSGVIIRDCEGSFSQGPLTITNAVTYNLSKCKSKVVIPYYKLLCMIAWRPFGLSYKGSTCGQRCFTVLNYLYTFLIFCVLFFWYFIRVYTCQGRLMLDTTHSTPAPTHAPTTTPPPNTTVHWSLIKPAKRMTPSGNLSHSHNNGLFLDPCQHVFGSYIVPNLLHFLAFVIGFFHFRLQDHEGLYALMEKVYLQTNCPGKMTKHLRIYLIVGGIWLLFTLTNMINYFFTFGFAESSGITEERPRLMYFLTTIIIISGLFAKSVQLAVVLSYCGQCQLLKFYINGVTERLEEKSTELNTAMKDVLDIKRHFNRLNGVLSVSMSCIVFNLLIVCGINVVLLFNYRQMSIDVWLYRLSISLQWGSMLLFLLIQAAVLSSQETKLREKVMPMRVFGYQSHTQLDIDSFLNFINTVELQAEIFTIPAKPRYLFGILIFSIQILIFAFQTGRVVGESKWV